MYSFHSLGAITWIQTSSLLPSGPKLYESLSYPLHIPHIAESTVHSSLVKFHSSRCKAGLGHVSIRCTLIIARTSSLCSAIVERRIRGTVRPGHQIATDLVVNLRK